MPSSLIDMIRQHAPTALTVAPHVVDTPHGLVRRASEVVGLALGRALGGRAGALLTGRMWAG